MDNNNGKWTEIEIEDETEIEDEMMVDWYDEGEVEALEESEARLRRLGYTLKRA